MTPTTSTDSNHPGDRVFLGDTEEDLQFERQAEQRRVEAFHSEYSWQGMALRPFSIGREALYLNLRSVNCRVPVHIHIAEPATFLGDALIVLYLCSHTPADWADVRSDINAFLQRIDAWAEQAVPREKGDEAVTLAIRILNEQRSTEAIPKPNTRGESHEGN